MVSVFNIEALAKKRRYIPLLLHIFSNHQSFCIAVCLFHLSRIIHRLKHRVCVCVCVCVGVRVPPLIAHSTIDFQLHLGWVQAARDGRYTFLPKKCIKS